MPEKRTSPSWLIGLGLSILLGPTGAIRREAVAQEVNEPVRRLRGVIDKDQTWSGLVLITDDLIIDGATVTIEAGTRIEFAAARPESHPILTVGAPQRSGGHLRLLARKDEPIVFGSRPDSSPGRLVINIRSHVVPNEAMNHRENPGAVHNTPRNVVWRYLRFERIGYARPLRLSKGDARWVEPAVTINVFGAAHSLMLADCTFSGTSRLQINAADGSRVTIERNVFDRTADKQCAEVQAYAGESDAEPIRIQENVLDAAISIRNLTADILGNILIGPSASLMLQGRSPATTRVVGNYVHNTTTADDGHYCLNCEFPDAVIENNVLRGGTTGVYRGSRHMRGNLIIAAPRLTSRYVRAARTHQLVNALPAGSVFERNLLVGPAYSLLVPQPLASRKGREESEPKPIVVRNNLFDGFGNTSRAIHLNALGHGRATVSVVNNIFLRVNTMVLDEAGRARTLIYADYNAAAPVPRRTYEPETGRWGAHDLIRADAAAIGMAAPLLFEIPDFDEAVRAGQTTVGDLRKRLFRRYGIRPNSPLVRAGCRQPDRTERNHPPSIGLGEPEEN